MDTEIAAVAHVWAEASYGYRHFGIFECSEHAGNSKSFSASSRVIVLTD